MIPHLRRGNLRLRGAALRLEANDSMVSLAAP
jgi:hypothetical protein